jgi:transcription-repair coupling factor (superfamily II helicase)
VSKEVKKGAALSFLEKALHEGGAFLFEGLWDSPKALLATLALSLKRSVLIVTSGPKEDRLFDNLSYFAPGRVIEFPAWETLPGEEIAPSPDILGKRFEALHLLCSPGPHLVLCPLAALVQKVLPKEALQISKWRVNQTLAFETIAPQLTSLGFRRVAVVSDKGEFAIRGGIVDLYPTSSPDPFRVEFVGDTIEEIRTFDPVGQKSIEKILEFLVCPAQELPFLQKASRLTTLLDYLGSEPWIFWDDLEAIEESYVALKKLPAARSPFLIELSDLLKRQGGDHLFFASRAIEELSEVKLGLKSKYLQPVTFEILDQTFEAKRFFHPFQRPHDYFEIEHLLELKTDVPLQILSSSETEEAELKPLFPSATFTKGYLHSGFVITDLPFALLPNPEFTERTRVRRQKWRGTTHTPASEFHELSPGDFVVHFHSGIGRYRGIEKQTSQTGEISEFLAIEYAENSKLFVPLTQAHLVSRYIGTKEETPLLSQLGSKRWATLRQNAQTQIVGYASELLDLYARRAVEGGFRYPPDSEMTRRFGQEFPYTETSDQLAAIQAIQNDMMSDKPMDRLICGDVGYGKTEVAMRAAFKAVIDGKKQVALLVPTTVLAHQHFDTFSSRMRGFPVRIEVISRLKTAKEARAILEKIANGEVDLLIGTHRLLSQDVHFKDLGLLIIDEEQRFGVKAKEHLKRFKAGVDTLTLSATPIPRTLYLSIVQTRDMSIIATPPQDRLPVKSIIAETDLPLIQNALLREMARGGQAYFIHNRVETIASRATQIGALVPSARSAIVHGQMEGEATDLVLHKFKNGETDLLFSTTLIENGIDIPNANTILIDRADTYGVADLYQLRGRVGRWNRAAYAYFLIPKGSVLPEATRKRLSALVEASGYGGGMKIAMRDLEIRGAGDLLGTQQSGHVASIGFHLYCKLLKKAIQALKQKQPVSFHECKIEAPFDARLPESYIPEVSIRLELYHRFGDASEEKEIEELVLEMQDRFGTPPLPALYLAALAKIRSRASRAGFTVIKFQTLSVLMEHPQGKKTVLLPKSSSSSPQGIEAFLLSQIPAPL